MDNLALLENLYFLGQLPERSSTLAINIDLKAIPFSCSIDTARDTHGSCSIYEEQENLEQKDVQLIEKEKENIYEDVESKIKKDDFYEERVEDNGEKSDGDDQGDGKQHD